MGNADGNENAIFEKTEERETNPAQNLEFMIFDLKPGPAPIPDGYAIFKGNRKIKQEWKWILRFLQPWVKYKNLISTMPLSTLLDLCGKQESADRLLHSSLHLVCLGIRGKPNFPGISGCVYYPEVGTIFHKACVFSSVDPDSTPDKKWSQILIQCKRFLPEKPAFEIYTLMEFS